MSLLTTLQKIFSCESENHYSDSKLTSAQYLEFKLRNISVLNNSSISPDSKIGDYTYIGCNCNITKAEIGRYVSIANNVSIGSGEHLLSSISTNSIFYPSERTYDILTDKACIIGHDVWIGVDSIIRRGVKIGNGAVVGANSFVNKDVPDFAIVAGNPAKIIKYRFDSSTATKISETKWWDLPFEEAKKTIKKLEVSSTNLQ